MSGLKYNHLNNVLLSTPIWGVQIKPEDHLLDTWKAIANINRTLMCHAQSAMSFHLLIATTIEGECFYYFHLITRK